MYNRVEERTPYVSVCLQECERMNNLLNEMRRSLKELRLGIKVGSLSPFFFVLVVFRFVLWCFHANHCHSRVRNTHRVI